MPLDEAKEKKIRNRDSARYWKNILKRKEDFVAFDI